MEERAEVVARCALRASAALVALARCVRSGEVEAQRDAIGAILRARRVAAELEGRGAAGPAGRIREEIERNEAAIFARSPIGPRGRGRSRSAHPDWPARV